MALHLADIEADLARRDVDGMEEAFRALVGWPKESAILRSSAGERKDLLVRICEALEETENARIMPRETLAIVLDECDEIDGITYADGARAVRGFVRPFFAVLDREG